MMNLCVRGSTLTLSASSPRVTVATAYPTGGRPVRLRARDNLQAAIDAARPGDVLLLPPGATYVGNFVLRNKRAEWLEYRSQVTPFELERYLPVL